MIRLGIEEEVSGFTRVVTQTLERGIVVTLTEDNRKKNYGLLTVVADREGVKMQGSIFVNSVAGIDDVWKSLELAYKYHEILRESFGRSTDALEELLDA
jgi:hypothetical protein